MSSSYTRSVDRGAKYILRGDIIGRHKCYWCINFIVRWPQPGRISVDRGAKYMLRCNIIGGHYSYWCINFILRWPEPGRISVDGGTSHVWRKYITYTLLSTHYPLTTSYTTFSCKNTQLTVDAGFVSITFFYIVLLPNFTCTLFLVTFLITYVHDIPGIDLSVSIPLIILSGMCHC